MPAFPLHLSGTMRRQCEGESKQRPEGLWVKVKYISVRLIQHLFRSVMTPADPVIGYSSLAHMDIAEEAGVVSRQQPSDISNIHNWV